MLHSSFNILEDDYSKKDKWVESEYLDDIIKHIAGFIVYSLKKKIHCKQCLNMLVLNNSDKSKFSELKNRGNLSFASNDVTLIRRYTERILSFHKDSLLMKNIYFKIVSETLKILPPATFHNNNHILEPEPLYDHRQQFIYLIVQNYIDIRLKHESDKLNDLKYRIRMYYNKLTIFSGQ